MAIFLRKLKYFIIPHNIIGYTFSYLLLIVIGAILLSLPFSLQTGQSISVVMLFLQRRAQ